MADTSVSPTSNMDVSDTTSFTEQPTTGADAATPPTQTPPAQPSAADAPQGSPQTPSEQDDNAAAQPNSPSGPNGTPNPANPNADPDRPTFGPNGAAGGHPAVQRAGLLHTIAQTLAGGPRYTETIDANTGKMTRTQVPMSKADIGMAIAMEAVTGSLAGLSQSGPGAAGRAPAAAAQATMQQRQQADQQQDQQANADFARHAQTTEANMRMWQNAQTVGRQNFDSQVKYGEQFKPLADRMQKDYPQFVKGIVNESDMGKYHIAKDAAMPTGNVVPKMDPKTGEQAQGAHGEPLWEHQYLVVDPNFKSDDLLTPEDKAIMTKYHMQGFVDSDGKPSDLPKSWQMRLGSVLGLKSKAATLGLAENDINDYYKKLDAHDTGASTPIWGLFKDTDALADFIVGQEGSGKPGSRGFRNNNEGNLIADKSWHGKVDTSNLAPEQKNVGYRIYDSRQEGRQALINQLNLDMRRTPNITPEDYFKKYDATNPAAYAANARSAAGLQPPSDTPNTPDRQAPDLVKAIQGDPTLVDALTRFQPILNKTQQNYAQAIGTLGQTDPQAAGKILALYGGTSAVNQYDQTKLLMQDQAKKRVEGQELLSRQAQERSQKNLEHAGEEDTAARAIAGDPNDPGSGDMTTMSDIFSMRTDQRGRVFQLAKKYNPNFNPKNAEQKLDAWKGFSDSQGKEYQQIKSANTLLDHIGGALEASNAFHDNTNYGQAINEPMNKFRKDYEGDPNLARLMTSIQPVKSEFMTYLNNQHALTEHDKSMGDDMLNWNMSPAVLEQNLKTFADTAAKRMQETNNGWKRVFGRDFPDLVSDSAVETLRKLGPDSDAAKTLANMQSGGSILGSSDGRGTPGKTIASLLGMNQPKPQPNAYTPPQGSLQKRNAQGIVTQYKLPNGQVVGPNGQALGQGQ